MILHGHKGGMKKPKGDKKKVKPKGGKRSGR